MKIKTLLVDDDIKNSQLIEHFVSTYSNDIEIIGKPQSIDVAIQLLEANDVDLIFLDIELENGENGFQFLDRLEHRDALVVFVTAFNDYAIKAFKYYAFDYILKPVVIDELLTTIENVKQKLGERSSNSNMKEIIQEIKSNVGQDRIAIPYMNKIEVLRKNELCYLRADGKYTEIFDVPGNSYWSSRNIGEYEEMLKQDFFIRIHHSCLINLNHLKTIDKTNGWQCIMTNGKVLSVSRRKQDELYDALNLRFKK